MASYSNRDLSLIPKFNFSAVDNYVKQMSSNSGDKHISKGVKYYKEGFVHDITGKYYIISSPVEVQHDNSNRVPI